MDSRYLIAAALVAATAASPALAERQGVWEANVQIIGNSSASASGENGAGLDVDSDVGFGVGFAYNFNSHLALGIDLAFLNPDYEVTIVPDGLGPVTIDHELDVFNGQVYGAWNFVDGPFTPYVQGGLGWTYVDSNISDGLPQTGCWWDPWWGYVCADFYDTYDDTSFSYGVGAGVRFEFQNGMFLKAGYDWLKIDSSGDGSDPDFDLWRAQLGWMIQ